jgi:hypothetical protein
MSMYTPPYKMEDYETRGIGGGDCEVLDLVRLVAWVQLR